MTRVILHQFPGINLDVGSFNVHHLYTGVLLLIAGGLPLIIRSPGGSRRWLYAALFGIGLGLVLDEWVYLIATEGTDEAYLSLESVAGAVIMTSATAIYIVILAWRGR